MKTKTYIDEYGDMHIVESTEVLVPVGTDKKGRTIATAKVPIENMDQDTRIEWETFTEVSPGEFKLNSRGVHIIKKCEEPKWP